MRQLRDYEVLVVRPSGALKENVKASAVLFVGQWLGRGRGFLSECLLERLEGGHATVELRRIDFVSVRRAGGDNGDGACGVLMAMGWGKMPVVVQRHVRFS